MHNRLQAFGFGSDGPDPLYPRRVAQPQGQSASGKPPCPDKRHNIDPNYRHSVGMFVSHRILIEAGESSNQLFSCRHLWRSAPASISEKTLASDQRCHSLARYWRSGLHRFLPLAGGNRTVCPDPMDLRHLQCCHSAEAFDDLIPQAELQSIMGGILLKLRK